VAGDPPEQGPVIVVRASEWVRAFVERKDAYELSQIGCATPDHVIRTKPVPLFVRRPNFEDGERLRTQLKDAIVEYGKGYEAYFDTMSAKKKVAKTRLDPWPRIALIPGVGLLAIGKSRAEAEIAADVYEHTIEVIVDAEHVGSYSPVPPSDLFDMEYWSLEQAKLKRAPVAAGALVSRIAVVTGAASGIGRATAKTFAEQGAHVVLVDREAGLETVAGELKKAHPTRIRHIHADVTSYDEVAAAMAYAVKSFGGLDLCVSNAGSAPEGLLDTQDGAEALKASLEVNLLGHNHVARAAVTVMKAQGRGGCLLFNASKAALNPGPRFGPYAVAKTALVALMRQYAIDAASAGIRANAVNADRVRTKLFAGGVLESRAAARGLSVDAYFRSNLLEREVAAEDVAAAFVFLATARATTGAILPVDGGNAAAFPR
jgi:NAD(P)-dependent dehydrogenase (short-subunit alcohol dehydrogenase family)